MWKKLIDNSKQDWFYHFEKIYNYINGLDYFFKFLDDKNPNDRNLNYAEIWMQRREVFISDVRLRDFLSEIPTIRKLNASLDHFIQKVFSLDIYKTV